MSKLEDGDWAELEAAYPCVLEEQWIAKQESLGQGLTDNDLPPEILTQNLDKNNHG